MSRKVLLIEPNYKNKYPPIGLMKLATYFRNRKDYVRFFKGDLCDLAVDLLFDEFWEKAYDPGLGEYTSLMRRYLKTGKLAIFDEIPDFESRQQLQIMRKRYQAGDYPKFDIVCITTLFTFYWTMTIETINFAKKFASSSGKVFVGGIASSILPDRLFRETGIQPWIGQLDRPGCIDEDDTTIIDALPLDYSILDEIDYVYPTENAYFGYMTRGCVNHCSFCAVPKLEPKYRRYISIKQQIQSAENQFGRKKDLLLLDNNVFASTSFNKIIDEIKELGFGKGAICNRENEYQIITNNIRKDYNVRTYIRKALRLYDKLITMLSEDEQGEFYIAREKLGLLYPDTASEKSVLEFDETFLPLFEKYLFPKPSRGRTRYIDFNQGVDARLISDAKMKKLAEINIKPLRIAFDHWGIDPQKPNTRPMHEIYTNAIELAAKYGITDLSNYLLYNSDDDTPDELYLRLELNVELCEKLQVSIYSFPMKYHPIDDPMFFNNRNFIGKFWNRKYIRAIQSILHSTRGKVGCGKSFFHAAFGADLNQFHEILLMPETFIIDRYKYDRKAYQAYLANGGTKKTCDEEIQRFGGMTDEWRRLYGALDDSQKKQANKIIYANIFTDETISVSDAAIADVLSLYKKSKCSHLDSPSI